eukprot:gene735-8987_t
MEVELDDELYDDYDFQSSHAITHREEGKRQTTVPPLQNLPQGSMPQQQQQPSNSIPQQLQGETIPQLQPNIPGLPPGMNFPGLPPGAQMTMGPNGVQMFTMVTTTTTTTENKSSTKASEVTVEINVEEDEEEVGEPIKPPKKNPLEIILHVPYFTLILMLAQTCYFGIVCYYGFANGDFAEFLTKPTFGPSEATLIQLGARRTDLIITWGQTINEIGFWRLFSSLFMTDGFISFVGTLMIEFFLFLSLEKKWGTLSFTIIWFCSALGGSILSAIFLPTVVSAGSPTGVSGIIAAILAEVIIRFSHDAHRWRNLATMFFQTAFIVLVGFFLPILDNFGTMGSVFCGFWAGIFTIWKSPLEKRHWVTVVLVVAKLVAVLLLAAYFIPATLVLFLWKDLGSSCYPNGICVYLNPTYDLLFGKETC